MGVAIRCIWQTARTAVAAAAAEISQALNGNWQPFDCDARSRSERTRERDRESESGRERKRGERIRYRASNALSSSQAPNRLRQRDAPKMGKG